MMKRKEPRSGEARPPNGRNPKERAPLTLREAYPFENNPNCERVLRMFELFGNEYRFKILCLLSRGEACVQQIVDILGSKYSNISQQLKILTIAGYLAKQRREKQTFYRLESAEIRTLLRFLENRYAAERGGEG